MLFGLEYPASNHLFVIGRRPTGDPTLLRDPRFTRARPQQRRAHHYIPMHPRAQRFGCMNEDVGEVLTGFLSGSTWPPREQTTRD